MTVYSFTHYYYYIIISYNKPWWDKIRSFFLALMPRYKFTYDGSESSRVLFGNGTD